jgi:hypothetical protein
LVVPRNAWSGLLTSNDLRTRSNDCCSPNLSENQLVSSQTRLLDRSSLPPGAAFGMIPALRDPLPHAHHPPA